jgi:hypothetical protein
MPMFGRAPLAPTFRNPALSEIPPLAGDFLRDHHNLKLEIPLLPQIYKL